MRKTLIAALTALTALALAAVAIAQNPAPSIDVKATVSPTKAGTKKKPKSEKLSLQIDNSRESKTSASKIEISFPKTLKLSTKGLKTCSVAKLDSQGKAVCPRGSAAGVGTADALVNPQSDNPALAEVQRHDVRGRQEPARLLPRAAGQRLRRPAGAAGEDHDGQGQQGLRPEAHDQHPAEPAAAGPGRVLHPDPDQELARPEVGQRTRSSRASAARRPASIRSASRSATSRTRTRRLASSASSTDGAPCSGKAL